LGNTSPGAGFATATRLAALGAAIRES
jgi:hypothetical protein